MWVVRSDEDGDGRTKMGTNPDTLPAVLICGPRVQPSLAVPHTPEQVDDGTTQQQVDAINEGSLSIKPEVEDTV